MVRMLISTCYAGKRYEQNHSYSVDAETEKRWIKNGIAETEAKSKPAKGSAKDDPETGYKSEYEA